MNSRIIEYELNKETKQIVINQNLDYGFAGEVWDGALVLCYYMIKNKDLFEEKFKNKVILELGSGTGVCGITTSIFKPSKLFLTDIDSAIPLITKNVEVNKKNLTNPIEIVPIDWNIKESYNNIKEEIDYIICSEIVFDQSLFEALLSTIKAFYIKGKTKIIFSYTYRKKEEKEFFSKLNHSLEINKVDIVKKEDYDCSYYADDIMIMELSSN